MKDIYNKLLNKGGLSIVLNLAISSIASLVLAIFAIMLAVILMIPGIMISDVSEHPEAYLIPILFVLLFYIFTTGIISLFTNAGMLGCFLEAKNGVKTSLKSFFENGKKYFWRYFGWSFIYGFSFLLVAIPFILLGAISLGVSGFESDIIIDFVVFIMSIIFGMMGCIWLIPMFVLKTLGLDHKNFISTNIKTMAGYGFLLTILAIVPGGIFFINIATPFLYLLILTLWINQHPEDNSDLSEPSYETHPHYQQKVSQYSPYPSQNADIEYVPSQNDTNHP